MKKTKKDVKETVPLFVYYDEITSYSREPMEDDAWDNGDTETDAWVSRVSKDASGGAYKEEFEVEKPIPENVYVVWVRYSTESTFGHETGRMLITGVFKTEKEAKEEIKLINSGNHSDAHYWTGYFEDFESAEYDKFKVHDDT